MRFHAARRPLLIAFVLLLAGIAPGLAAQSSPRYDVLIRGGTVVDGTGAGRVAKDVALRGDRIVAVAASIDPALADSVVDARGLVVAPGFIDNHAHVAPTIRDFPLEENFIRQGITTIIASLHSTDQPWPLAPYMDRLKMAPNVAFFAGHTWIRKKVMGLDNRAPTAAELASMKAMVDQSMRDGALGLATGLEYVPATYSTAEEIIELAKVASRHGGIYVSHVRNEDVDSLKSMDEIIRIAREAKIPVQVNHHKVAGAAQFGMSVKTLAMVDQARAAGLDVKIDVYPYTAFSTFAYYDPAMSLYSVRLDEAGEEALAAAARAPKVSRAVILREAIAEYASVAGREVSPRIRMSSLIGVIEDGPGNLSEQTGRALPASSTPAAPRVHIPRASNACEADGPVILVDANPAGRAAAPAGP